MLLSFRSPFFPFLSPVLPLFHSLLFPLLPLLLVVLVSFAFGTTDWVSVLFCHFFDFLLLQWQLLCTCVLGCALFPFLFLLLWSLAPLEGGFFSPSSSSSSSSSSSFCLRCMCVRVHCVVSVVCVLHHLLFEMVLSLFRSGSKLHCNRHGSRRLCVACGVVSSECWVCEHVFVLW